MPDVIRVVVIEGRCEVRERLAALINSTQDAITRK